MDRVCAALFDSAVEKECDGDIDEAERLFRQCVRGCIRAHGVGNEYTLLAEDRWASMLLKKEQFELAEEVLRRVLEQRTAPSSPTGRARLVTFHITDDLVKALCKQCKFDDARKVLAASVKERTRTLGASHPMTCAASQLLDALSASS